MRGYSLLLFGLWFGTAICIAHADETDPNEGHIGCALSHTKGSDFLTVEYIAANSPAAIAGIKQGDFITSIDGISTKGMSLKDAEDSIHGDIGGAMKLTVRHEGTTDEQISVIRQSLLDTFSPAALAGNPRAEFYLGHFYEHGPTSTRDLTKAAHWYFEAARQNFAPAEAYLGYMCRNGLGVKKDQNAAAVWLRAGAKQGDPFAERELASVYLNGEGLQQSDQDAFAWFYSAAQQDDPTAEQNLGLLYRKGRGVGRSDRDAFAWYYRSAQLSDPYGAWGLAYMYENGLGVTKNLGEALKWYQKAQAGLPQNEKLRRLVVGLSIKAFLENPDFSAIDLSLIMATYRPQIVPLFIILALAYGAGGIILFYFSLRAPDASPKLFVAIGWVIFYVESQAVALFALVIFGKSLTADTLMVATSIFSALPVVAASSCGPLRDRVWKPSQSSWKTLLIYVIGSCLAIFAIGLGYAKIYFLIAHSPLPLQPTQMLITKAKHESLWLAYASVVLALPIAEELIFRSFLFDALRRRFSGNIVVIVTAFAFSLVHFQLVYLVPLFGFGLVLGWVRLKTDSVRLPVFLHVINNGLFLAVTT
jgi:TPR repeat protein/membrane protease YdiL (CAAX protease family)